MFKSFLTFATALLLLAACHDDDETGTNAPQPDTPQLTTLAVSEITASSAQSGGNVTSDGGFPVSSRGVVWSTEQAPTLESHLGLTVDGVGLGVFTSAISGLNEGESYYVRAYATNSRGTAYGQGIEFNTFYPTGTVHCIEGGAKVVDVINPVTGKTWMDRNLGASQAATSSTDEASYGDLYQWGRFSDGHQCRTSPITSSISSSDTTGHGQFILSSFSDKWDWRNPHNNNLWQGVNGNNNPCPQGYRLPTEAELTNELLSWSSNNSAGAFDSPLKLPVAGVRSGTSGGLIDVGSVGQYWSSTVSVIFTRYLLFIGGGVIVLEDGRRAFGLSLRCLKD